MELHYIAAEDWHQLEVRHRAAYLFLLTASLKGELRSLQREAKLHASHPETFTSYRLEYVAARITELTKYAETKDEGPAV